MGGHSYSHHHHHHHTSRIHYGRSGGGGGGGGGSCCACNCNAVCAVVLMMICTLVLVFVIISATFPKPSHKYTELSLSETRIVTVSPNWHDKISGGDVLFSDITRNRSQINDGTMEDDVTLMRFNSRPPLTGFDSWVLNEPTLSVEAYDHYYWSWYLFEGSSIAASWNFSDSITVYFIRSVKGYNHYYDDTASQDKYILRKQNSNRGNISFTAAGDDIYFVVFENWDRVRTVRGSGKFTIRSTLLDVSGVVESCSLPCSLDVPYSGNSFFVMHTPTVSSYAALGKGSPNSVFSFELRKHSRVWYIVFVAYIVPLIVITFVTVVIVLIIKRKNLCGKQKQVSTVSMGATVPPPTIDGIPMVVYPIAATPYPPPSYPPSSYPPALTYPPSSTYPAPDGYPPPSSAYPSVYPPQAAGYPPPSSDYPPPSSYPPPNAPPPTSYPPPDAYTPGGPPPPSSSTTQYPPADAYTPSYSAAPLPPHAFAAPPPPPPPSSPPYNPNYEPPSFPPS